MTAPPDLPPQRGGTETEHSSRLSVRTEQDVETTNKHCTAGLQDDLTQHFAQDVHV